VGVLRAQVARSGVATGRDAVVSGSEKEREKMSDDDDSYISSNDPAPMVMRAETTPVRASRPHGTPRMDTAMALSETRLATSHGTDAVVGALCRAQMSYGKVVKTRRADAGARGSYTYANLADVAEAVMPALRDQGLFVMQVPSGDVLVTRVVHGESGQWIEGSMPLIKPDTRGGVQALGSALTYMRRYSLTAMLGIVPEEDDDGASAMGNGQQKPKGRTLADHVAELAQHEDIAAAREQLIADMGARGVSAETQQRALADFDARAGRPAA
jgi:hypothetical protein